VETLFREAHSLKGAARSVNLADIERVCQPMERVLSALKRGELALSPEFFKTMYASVDGLGQILARDVRAATDVDGGLPALLSRSLLTLMPGGSRMCSTPKRFKEPGLNLPPSKTLSAKTKG